MKTRHQLLGDHPDRETWVLFSMAADAALIGHSGLEAEDFTSPSNRAGFSLLAERAEDFR